MIADGATVSEHAGDHLDVVVVDTLGLPGRWKEAGFVVVQSLDPSDINQRIE